MLLYGLAREFDVDGQIAVVIRFRSRDNRVDLPSHAITLGTGAVAWMAPGRGFSAWMGGGVPILVPGSGGCESLPVDLEQVMDGAQESPLTRGGVESSP